MVQNVGIDGQSDHNFIDDAYVKEAILWNQRILPLSLIHTMCVAVVIATVAITVKV